MMRDSLSSVMGRGAAMGAVFGSSVALLEGGSPTVAALSGLAGLVSLGILNPWVVWKTLSGTGERNHIFQDSSLRLRNERTPGNYLGLRSNEGRYTRLHYHEFGKEHKSKGTTVLIHGFQSHSGEWEYFVPAFADRHVIAIDLPGCGYSDMLFKNDYSFPGTVTQALRLFFDYLKLDKFSIVANSMGTGVALTYSLENPGQVSRQVLFSPIVPTGPDYQLPTPLRHMKRDNPLARLIRKVPALSDALQKALFRMIMWEKLFGAPQHFSEAEVRQQAGPFLRSVVDQVRLEDMMRARGAWAKGMENYLRMEVSSLAGLTTPSLFVFPEGDTVLERRLQNAARAFAERSPAASIKDILFSEDPLANHAYPTVRPQAAAAIAREFLDHSA